MTISPTTLLFTLGLRYPTVMQTVTLLTPLTGPLGNLPVRPFHNACSYNFTSYSVCASTDPCNAYAQTYFRGYWIKVHKMFTPCRGFIGVKVSHPFCDPANSCRMLAERMKTGCVNFR